MIGKEEKTAIALLLGNRAHSNQRKNAVYWIPFDWR
jgi:hypothetical protein